MKSVRITSAVFLFSALAFTVPVFAQHGHENHGRGHEMREDRGESHHDEYRGGGHEQRREGEYREHRGNAYGHDRIPPGQAKKMYWEDHRARNWAHEHQTWRMRGGYRGYMVPRERFVAYFGPRHFFRVHSMPVVIVAGHPRFYYSGFYVTMVDPWPEYWAPNWYETDDVYVDYVNDGYYMFNRRHPGVSIAVNISM